MSVSNLECHPERGPAQERIKPAFGLVRWLGRVEGPAFHHVQRHRKPGQQQILRLRARATRKRSGPEKPRGRFAQDDSTKIAAVMNNPG